MKIESLRETYTLLLFNPILMTFLYFTNIGC